TMGSFFQQIATQSARKAFLSGVYLRSAPAAPAREARADLARRRPDGSLVPRPPSTSAQGFQHPYQQLGAWYQRRELDLLVQRMRATPVGAESVKGGNAERRREIAVADPARERRVLQREAHLGGARPGVLEQCRDARGLAVGRPVDVAGHDDRAV